MKSIDLKQLAAQYGLKISTLAHRMINNSDLAKEAAQEVWIQIIKSIDTFRGESEIGTWIYIIAKRTILQYARHERIYSDTDIDGHFDLEPIDYTGSDEEKKEWVKQKCDSCLTAFCHCLNNESRLIFLLHFIAALDYSEISDIMELQEDNVRQIIFRSKEKIKHFMNRNCVLYNPDGECRCRIRKHVLDVDLDKVYRKFENLVNFYEEFDKNLPRKNYSEKVLSELSQNGIMLH